MIEENSARELTCVPPQGKTASPSGSAHRHRRRSVISGPSVSTPLGPPGDPCGQPGVDALLALPQRRRETLGIEACPTQTLAEPVLVDGTVLVDEARLIGATLEVRRAEGIRAGILPPQVRERRIQRERREMARRVTTAQRSPSFRVDGELDLRTGCEPGGCGIRQPVTHEPRPSLRTALDGDRRPDGELPLRADRGHHGLRDRDALVAVREKPGIARLVGPGVVHRMEGRPVHDHHVALDAHHRARAGHLALREGHPRLLGHHSSFRISVITTRRSPP